VNDVYVFRINGRLTPTLIGALEPLEEMAAPTETVLVGQVTDRAELHGLIARIEALGLELVGLRRLPPHNEPAPRPMSVRTVTGTGQHPRARTPSPRPPPRTTPHADNRGGHTAADRHRLA
jgi:hypothetical protein